MATNPPKEVKENGERDKDKGNQRKVFVKVNFIKLAGINTIKEEFTADVVVQTRWREPTLDSSKETSATDLSKFWDPKIIVSNAAPSVSCKTWRSVKHGKDGKAYIVEKRRMKGLFAENLELHDFPFDIQDLSIVVSSELQENVLDIVEDDEEISAVNVVCFVDETEWTICDLVYTEPRTFQRELTETQFKNPALLVKCVAKRRPGFFMYNIILIMTMITSLGFTTFSVDIDKTPNRLQLMFILTLTGVTFLMVTNQSLPKIPYLTHLDRFIIGSMLFSWAVCVWHGIVSLYDDKSYQKDMDFWAFITAIIIYALFNIAFYVFALTKRLIQEYRLKEREAAYQEKAVRLMGSSWKDDRTARQKAWTKRGKISGAGTLSVRVAPKPREKQK